MRTGRRVGRSSRNGAKDETRTSSPSDPVDRLSSNDLIERVAMWAVEMNLWRRHDTSLPAFGGARRSYPGAAQGSGSPPDGQWTMLGMAMSPTVRTLLG